MFDRSGFIAECQGVLESDGSARTIKDIVARAVSEPSAVIKEFGVPASGGLETIHRSPELTILNVIWPVGQIVMPHEHKVWAVVGIYAGREDNILWRRLPGDAAGRIEAMGGKSLGEREAAAFGPDIIHSVVNPLARATAAIHVYGGDFFGVRRSEWDPESLRERPYDMDKVLRMFATQQPDRTFGFPN